jgi:hypothetical protein
VTKSDSNDRTTVAAPKSRTAKSGKRAKSPEPSKLQPKDKPETSSKGVTFAIRELCCFDDKVC